MSIVQAALERAKANRVAEARTASPGKPLAAASLGSLADVAAARVPLSWPARSTVIQVDRERLRERSLYPVADAEHRLQDDYRSIRREVMTATQQRPDPEGPTVGPIVVVTSALPGDGKSFTALNLALSIASEGIHEVLLIDADTVRRSITTAMGVEDSPGLIELLAGGGRDFMELTHPTSIEQLHLLPAGRRFDGASDLFSNGRVGPLFAAIRGALDGHVVIIDTAPLLLSSETPVLTDAAGQVLLVVRAGTTLQDSIKDAASRIKSTVPVGLVLNAWEPVLPSEKKTYDSYEGYIKRQAS
jgi:protein-tyrosine kinase